MRYLLLGAIDGIITAGTLSATLILRRGTVEFGLFFSLLVVVASINALTVFVAEFSHLVREVREVSYKLALREEARRWTLLHSKALLSAAKSSLLNFASSAVGASVVLLPSLFNAYLSVVAIIAAIVAISLSISNGVFADFIQFVFLIGVAVTVGLLVGLVFPVVA